jgi:hypothetical protein
MRPIDHRTARRWVNARLDGALDLESQQRLEDHLLSCPECQQFATQILGLDADLYQEFAARPLPDRLPSLSLPARLALPTSNPARAPMTKNPLAGFIRSAAYIAALVVLTGGLAFLFSNLIPQPGAGRLQPLSGSTSTAAVGYPAPYPESYLLVEIPTQVYPYPQPENAYPRPGGETLTNTYPQPNGVETGSPYPGGNVYPGPVGSPPATPNLTSLTGQPVPPTGVITSPLEISQQLNFLANQAEKLIQANPWVTIHKSKYFESGLLITADQDRVYHAPRKDDRCGQSLIINLNPGDNKTIIEMQTVTADGLSGDLMQLRQGSGQVNHLSPTDPGCRWNAAYTDAGQLALRLMGHTAATLKYPEQVRQVQAWETTLDGKSILIVRAEFSYPLDAPLGKIETLAFDQGTGMLLEERMYIREALGKQDSEWAARYQTTYGEAPPAELTRIFQQAVQELPSYAGLNRPPGNSYPLPENSPPGLNNPTGTPYP